MKPWLLLLLFAHSLEASHILVVFAMPGKSHSILGDGIVRNLLEAGHEVTYITPFPKNSTNPMLHEVDVSDNLNYYPREEINIQAIMDKEVNVLLNANIFKMFSLLTRNTLKIQNVQKLLQDTTQKFDLVILQWIFSSSNVGFAAVFNCPYIFFSTTEVHTVVLSLIDEASNPAYVPTFITGNVPPFTFLQRAKELALQVFLYILDSIYFQPNDKETYELGFGPAVALRGRSLPPYEDVKYNSSLMLGNSHVSLGGAPRLPANYKNIGGFHIESDPKPLPKDLKKIMDASKDGVIYFSMGSNLRGKDWPSVLKQELVKMFGSLKQTVLWKFEEQLPDLPKNLHILTWAPQQSILAHPNCRLFITHGGHLSTTETIHFGIPVIGIPVYGDQFGNIDRAVKKGFAIRVDLTYDVVKDLRAGIEEVLRNPSYTNTAKLLSMIYHDRMAPPGAELVHWVDHVIRTNGAPHLRSAALTLPWYQKCYIDLLLLVVGVLGAFVMLVRKLCCGRKKDLKKKIN